MKLIKLAAVLAMLCFTQLTLAAGATKVAVLDVQAVVLLSDVGKAGMAELEKNSDYIALKGKLDNMNAELATLVEKAKNNSLIWGEEQKEEHAKKVNELNKEKQATMAHLNRGREGVFMQLLQILEPGIGKATEMVMQAEGIELILDSKAVVLKMPTTDISQMVVSKINQLNSQAAAEAKDKSKPSTPKKASK